MSDPVVGGSQHEFVDLHTHSTASDGARAPADVVKAGKAAGLAALALTDHDTLAGVADAREAGTQLGMRVVTGVELSAVEGDVETHILGLHLSDLAELEQQGYIEATEERHPVHLHVAVLTEPGKIASWIAPPAAGVKGKPFEFEYVRL